MDQRFDDAFVPLIETVPVDLEHGQRAICQLRRDFPVRLHLDVIAYPAEQVVRSPWRAARACCDFRGAFGVDWDAEQASAAGDDFMHLFCAIIVETRAHSETRT